MPCGNSYCGDDETEGGLLSAGWCAGSLWLCKGSSGEASQKAGNSEEASHMDSGKSTPRKAGPSAKTSQWELRTGPECEAPSRCAHRSGGLPIWILVDSDLLYTGRE